MIRIGSGFYPDSVASLFPVTFELEFAFFSSFKVLNVILKGGGYRSLGFIYIIILIYSDRQALDADPDPGR